MKKTFLRNFCIISHIDHGKSTLADALLEVTNSLSPVADGLVMDDLPIEKARGITIKMNAATFRYQNHTLNLIDTPGHFDFNYEVKRALYACEGAILLVDATKGIQAQTLANLNLARQTGLKIIPVINKIDLPSVEIAPIKTAMATLLKFDPNKILLISAKKRLNIEAVLQAIVAEIPPPQGKLNDGFEALVFDAKYDGYRGVILFIRILNGSITGRTKIENLRTNQIYEISEVGIRKPELVKQQQLEVGEVGYLQTNLKNLHAVKSGDWIAKSGQLRKRNSNFLAVQQPNVFANIFPLEVERYKELANALSKIALNDAAFSFQKINSGVLGSGFHAGFLGLLHLEIIQERLEKEEKVAVIITLPTVKYEFEFANRTKEVIENIEQITNWQVVKRIAEPFVDVKIITPLVSLGKVMKVGLKARGSLKNEQLLNETTILLEFTMPLKEIITSLLDDLKSASNGYASFTYGNERFIESNLVKLTILLNGTEIAPFAQIVHRQNSEQIGRDLCKQLKQLLPQQNFQIRIQAAINNKIIARETISAYHKDVTAKCYGGDISRKRKLWAKQKAGKKKLRMFGKVAVPHNIFVKIMRK